MSQHPHFTEYVIARLVTTAVTVFILFSALILFLVSENSVALLSIGLLALAFLIFVFIISKGAKRMQKELRTINVYLKNLEKIDKIDYKTHFFTQEFDELNQNLIKVLNKAKKREDIKHRYNAKLKLKNRQRADMLSAIAHEFRNPIASIMGYSQTLHEDPEIPQELQAKFLSKIYNNGNKIEALLSRLILWNKFESKEANLHKSDFDILTLAMDIKQVLEESYMGRSIEIKGDTMYVNADRTLIEIVLKNLMENALKYSKETIRVEIDERSVKVIDKGVGIGKKDLDKVTKKFYRSGTHSWDNSMGLGLSIVKAILSLHKSELKIESVKEEGSRFSFFL